MCVVESVTVYNGWLEPFGLFSHPSLQWNLLGQMETVETQQMHKQWEPPPADGLGSNTLMCTSFRPCVSQTHTQRCQRSHPEPHICIKLKTIITSLPSEVSRRAGVLKLHLISPRSGPSRNTHTHYKQSHHHSLVLVRFHSDTHTHLTEFYKWWIIDSY